MKKFYFIAIVAALCACSHEKEHTHYKRYHVKNDNNYVQLAENENNKTGGDKVKFSYRVRPSESMAAGVPKTTAKNSKFHSIRAKNKEKISSKSINTDLEDIVIDEKYVGQYKVGHPYQIEDIVYYPQVYEYYEEVGKASWYGDEFHGRSTANGEKYNLGAMTAAHQTLPLPSMVRVTNLDNGKTAIVRVNDRGPFAKSRIIDVSEAAADKLGFKGRGTATVKVELLEKETNELHKTLNVNDK